MPGPRDDDDEEENAPPSPTPDRSRSGGKAATLGTRSGRGQRGRGPQQGKATQGSIQERPYCTHQCLLGLAYDGPMDKTCPNAGSHGPRHIGRVEFLLLLRAQLAEDRGPDADSTPLYLSGVGRVALQDPTIGLRIHARC